MSGSLEVHGTVDSSNWTSVKTFLFETPTLNLKHDAQEPDDWSWDDDGGSETPTSSTPTPATTTVTSPRNENNWAQECVISGSPMGDFLVVCRLQKAVFLSGEWNMRMKQTKYSKQFEGKLSTEGENITSASCIPLISNKKTSPGAHDWTCIVVGFSDGYVRMYTENGTLLISQMFHNEPVVSIKCRSYQQAATATEHEQLEELFIVYKTVLVTIDGFGLFQTLRACRNRVARLQANAEESMVDPPPLSYKKWQYESENVSDCESVGVQTPSSFDHLLIASVNGGLAARTNKVAYTSTVFVTAGEKPYVSFHYAQEGQATPYLGDIAYAVASKLKSSLINAATGWLGFGGGSSKPTNQPVKPEKPKIEPATAMGARFGLPDKDRKGQSIAVSPCRKLSAVTDGLGRVVLIDNDREIAVRMWKGYREAQCAWLLVDDDMTSKSRVSGRKALFLVIYAPRRGQLEVFAMQQGPKVASLPVSKSGRLLVTPYGMMGLNNIPIKGGGYCSTYQCLFMDHEAQLYHLHVPFHLALCGGSNTKLKDMHLLKTLQRTLRDTKYSAEEVNAIVYDLATQSLINQSFKILIQYCKNFTVLTKVIEDYLEKFCEDEGRDLSLVFRIQSLLHLYSFLIKAIDMPPAYSSSSSGGNIESTSQENTILMCLHATEKEMKLVKDMANKEVFNKSTVKNVSFQDEKQVVTANEFLAFFVMEYDPAKLKIASSSNENYLKLNRANENLPKLGQLLFGGCFNSNLDFKEWQSIVKNCALVPSELLLEALRYWCSNALASSSFVEMMERLYHVIRELNNLEGISSTISETSVWWDTLRKEIASSSRIFYIYTFSIVSRAVSIDILQETDKDKASGKSKSKLQEQEPPLSSEDGAVAHSSSSNTALETSKDMEIVDDDYEEWENVSLDLIKWNILLKQIEDLSFLTTILAQRPPLSNPVLPLLPKEIEEMSVISLLEKGTGCIAEIVGRWLTTIGVDPAAIVDESEVDIPETRVSPEYTEKELKQKMKVEQKALDDKMQIDEVGQEQKLLEESANSNSEISYIVELLRCLKENFPVSLSSSIIIGNYCWEYCLAWNQNPEVVDNLIAAVKCVKYLPSNLIKQGLMSMMWNTFISKQLANIIAKGKISKEKRLDKVVDITGPENKVAFLDACVKFFDDFLETNQSGFGVASSKSKTKKNHWNNGGASAASLTDLALMQQLPNYDMLLLHYQVSMTALFVYNFNIKKASMRPIKLFGIKDSMMFFSTLNTRLPYPNTEVDLALKVLRSDFLCLIVSSAIGKIPEDLDNSLDDESSSELKYISPSICGVKECEKWLQLCFELARIWNLDLESLKINQVCEYYSSGFDFLGLETIGTVTTSKEVLGSKLLVIAGMRLQYVIQTNRDSVTEMVSSMSTNLTNWLNKLDYSKLRCLRFPKTSVREIVLQVVQLIPDSSYDYSLAEDMLVGSSFLN